MGTTYVLCFCLSEDGENIALIQKRRPAWQAGRFNAPGGKVEKGENSKQAAAREFHEETGVDIPTHQWGYFALMHGPGWSVVCYVAISDDVFSVESRTDEAVSVHRVDNLPPNAIGNLRTLVDAALMVYEGIKVTGMPAPFFTLEYAR